MAAAGVTSAAAYAAYSVYAASHQTANVVVFLDGIKRPGLTLPKEESLPLLLASLEQQLKTASPRLFLLQVRVIRGGRNPGGLLTPAAARGGPGCSGLASRLGYVPGDWTGPPIGRSGWLFVCAVSRKAGCVWCDQDSSCIRDNQQAALASGRGSNEYRFVTCCW